MIGIDKDVCDRLDCGYYSYKYLDLFGHVGRCKLTNGIWDKVVYILCGTEEISKKEIPDNCPYKNVHILTGNNK